MTQITGGFIEYSEQREPNVFGSPKATARFDFGVADGDTYEATAQLAATKARSFVRTLIGLANAGAVVDEVRVTPSSTAAAAAPAASGTKEAAAAAMNAADAAAPPKRGRKASATIAAVEPASVAGSPAATAAAPAPAADSMDDFMTGEPAKPISDVELNDAVQKKFKETGDSASIRALTGTFVPPGKAVNGSNIPQENRAKYLEALAALKKA
jgi:hypothetical protein